MTNLKNLKIDGFWYLATPYSKYPAGLEFAFSHACNVAGRLLAEGVHVYSPIAHTHPVAQYGGLDPFCHDTFLPLDKKIMEHAHGCLVIKMPGWESSKGILWEVEYFEKAGRPIELLEWPELTR